MRAFRRYAQCWALCAAIAVAGACIVVGEAHGQAACQTGCYLINWFLDGGNSKHWTSGNTNVCIDWASTAALPGGRCAPPANIQAFSCGNLKQVTVQWVFTPVTCCNGGTRAQDDPAPTSQMGQPQQLPYPIGCNIQKS